MTIDFIGMVLKDREEYDGYVVVIVDLGRFSYEKSSRVDTNMRCIHSTGAKQDVMRLLVIWCLLIWIILMVLKIKYTMHTIKIPFRRSFKSI